MNHQYQAVVIRTQDQMILGYIGLGACITDDNTQRQANVCSCGKICLTTRGAIKHTATGNAQEAARKVE